MLKKIGVIVAVLIVVGGVFLGGQYIGLRKKQRPVEWFSQASGRYLINEDMRCPSPDGGKTPGKLLGKIQADFDLTNGKWKVVRNDPGKWPSCE